MTKTNSRTRKLAHALSWVLSLAVVWAICLSCITAFAAGDGLTQSVTVKQEVVGSPTKTTYTYYLMPMEKGNPMPSEKDGGKLENGLYKFTLKGNDSAKFNLTFTEPGTYNYELRRTEPAPDGDTVTPTIHPFGYIVKQGESGLEIIPFTCYDEYMEIRDVNGNPAEIVLTNTLEKTTGCNCDKNGSCNCKTDGCKCGSTCTCKNCTKSSSSGGSSSGSKTSGGTSNGTGTRAQSKNTGDPYQIGTYVAILVVSGGALIAIAVLKRKREKDEDF